MVWSFRLTRPACQCVGTIVPQKFPSYIPVPYGDTTQWMADGWFNRERDGSVRI